MQTLFFFLQPTGLQEDCPFEAASTSGDHESVYLTAENVETIVEAAFTDYVGRLNTYLQV